jgi:hypothetical protein
MKWIVLYIYTYLTNLENNSVLLDLICDFNKTSVWRVMFNKEDIAQCPYTDSCISIISIDAVQLYYC